MPPAKPAQKGNNIFEFLVERKDREEAKRVIRAKAEGKCLIGEEEVGPRVKLTVILYSDTPEKDAAGILADLERSSVQIHQFRAGHADKEVDF